jgi:predicted ester cyclase
LLFKSDRISWLSTLSLFVALPIEAEAQPDENEERKLHMTHKLTPRKQQLAAFYEAFNGNLGALDRILIPDWVSHEPNPGQGKGRQGLKDFIGLVRKSVPDLKVTVEDMIEEGDKIAVRLAIAGTHRGPMLGVGATGKPFSVRAHDIHRFGADDMVLESWHIEDWLSFLFQVGAMK